MGWLSFGSISELLGGRDDGRETNGDRIPLSLPGCVSVFNFSSWREALGLGFSVSGLDEGSGTAASTSSFVAG